MRYYLDENFPVLAQPVLEGGGAEVFRAVERQGHSSIDHDVLADAQALGAILLTTDKDFFHREAPLLNSLSASIVVIALRRPSSPAILQRLWDLMDAVALATDPPAVYLVTDTRIIRA